jgi:hypothetical protein
VTEYKNPQINTAKSVFTFNFLDQETNNVFQFKVDMLIKEAEIHPSFLLFVNSQFQINLMAAYRLSCDASEKFANGWIDFINYQYLHSKNKTLFLNLIDTFVKNEPTESNTDWFYTHIAQWVKTERLFCEGLSIINTPNQHYGEIKNKPPLTVRQVALLMFYSENTVTRQNALDVIIPFGHKKAGSLYKDFGKCSDRLFRVGDPGSKRAITPKIKDLEAIINHLGDGHKDRAITDLKVLREIEERYY